MLNFMKVLFLLYDKSFEIQTGVPAQSRKADKTASAVVSQKIFIKLVQAGRACAGLPSQPARSWNIPSQCLLQSHQKLLVG